MTIEAGTERLSNYIGGRWVPSSSDNEDIVPNPATGEQLARVPFSEAKEAAEAVAAAAAAFPEWSRTPVPKRARLLFKYQQLLVEHWDELARLITLENGKSYTEAHGEVLRGIECVEFAAGAPSLMMGSHLPDIATGIESGMYRYPLGVVAGIAPFNFPMMVPCWMFPLAIACGNTFVLKPSERTPLLANRLAELLERAGVPGGVFNVVHGSRDVVNELIRNKEVKAISFVGSQPVAEYVYREAAANGKRVQALGGAKNHTIVLPDANLELAVKEIVNAAFGSAGERCMACSVVVAVGETGERLAERLRDVAAGLAIGNGLEEGVFLGPVIRRAHKERTYDYIRSGVEEGCKLLLDGRKTEAGEERGFFVAPTIFDHVTPEARIWKEEIFAPVLSIARAATLEEAIALANRSEFANGACLFTNDARAIRRFRETVDAGMLGINVGVPAPMAFFPFCGYKKSFYGDLHANGRDGVEFYTRKKMVVARYS